MNMKDILSVMATAVKLAELEFHIFYVYQNAKSEFFISSELSSNWLFKAYPGGRKVLSMAGRELLSLDELSALQ